MLDSALSTQAASEFPSDDYGHVRRAVEFITAQWQEQPDLGVLAAHLKLSPAYTQRLFKRWCGVSPKEFVRAITMEQARGLLESDATVLDATLEVGLSGPGRLHDLFIDHEAMTPGDYKRRGEGLTIRWGLHACPFGQALLMVTDRGVCGLSFCDSPGDADATFADMASRWPAARYAADGVGTASAAQAVFAADVAQPLRLVMIGTDFEVRVWRALAEIPVARTVSYGGLAAAIGAPGAARAVGRAVGRNPLGFVVPCHRVVAQGGIGGYRWGVTRKRAIIGWERARITRSESTPYPQ